MNDEQREEWVQNDEGLYVLQQASRLGLRAWVRGNRELVDAVAAAVSSGKTRAHALRYGS